MNAMERMPARYTARWALNAAGWRVLHQLNRLLRRRGLEVGQIRPDHEAVHLSSVVQARMVDAIATALWPAFATLPGALDRAALRATIAEFQSRFQDCPVAQTTGGMGFNGGVKLYCVLRHLRPRVIIESGVFKGMTTWLMRLAAPDAVFHCFDIDFTPLVHRDPQAVYTQADVTTQEDVLPDGPGVFAFFDDHVSQLERASLALRKGWGAVYFDDDFGLSAIPRDRAPASPTMHMVFRCADEFPPQTYEWLSGGQMRSVTLPVPGSEALRARGRYVPLPPLAGVTGFLEVPNSLVDLRPK